MFRGRRKARTVTIKKVIEVMKSLTIQLILQKALSDLSYPPSPRDGEKPKYSSRRAPKEIPSWRVRRLATSELRAIYRN